MTGSLPNFNQNFPTITIVHTPRQWGSSSTVLEPEAQVQLPLRRAQCFCLPGQESMALMQFLRDEKFYDTLLHAD